ncbi:glycogen synthase [Candidatus Nomurabacteria bacterium]|nr:glycogen synthase [Candidatus Nomurabacteria bacterium]
MINKMKVLFVGAELAPLVKVGGLGDVMGSLPKALIRNKVDLKIIIPFYGAIDKKKFLIKLFKKNIKLEIDQQKLNFDLYQTYLPGSKIKVFLIKHKLFDHKEIYVGHRKYLKGRVYSRSLGDIERFVFFSKAVVETIKQLNWQLDIVHCHDWHTALIPTLIDEYSLEDQNFKNIKTVFTIHNLANQGVAPLDIVDYGGLHHDLTPALMEDYYDRDGDKIDMMKVGILSADLVNTVSPNYAKEILSKEYGEKLEAYLLRRKKHLFGIVNGIDLDFFNPQKDQLIYKKYNLKNYKSGKLANKQALQKELKLPLVDVPVFGLVSRLVRQKGLDILIPTLQKLLHKTEMQIIILGTGQEEYEDDFKALEKKYPSKVKAKITFDIKLAQKIYAASDFFLMPSSFEPCGLGQMIAMRYGSLPIVRATGGLKDTVKHKKTGLVFKNYKASELHKVFLQALKLYRHKSAFDVIIKAAMKEDFSWAKSAADYIKLYKKLI